MLIRSLRIGCVGLVLCISTAWAATSVLQGIVKDPQGHPIKGADVRIESRDGSKLLKTVKTDANGAARATNVSLTDGLPAGTYRVILVVNGAVKASINNTKTKADGQTQLNFDLKPAPSSQAATAAKSGKHMVWVPARTGSHMGGTWVEVDDTGSSAPGSSNVQSVSAQQLEQQAHSADAPGHP